MRYLKWTDIFTEKDIRKMKERLLWVVENTEKPIFIFNRRVIPQIRERAKEQGVDCCWMGKGTTLFIEDIIIEWDVIGGQKAILKSIENKDGKVIYAQPETWEESELWYQFK